MTDVISEVKVCLYKPTGFEDTWFVDTQNRGEAVKKVMGQYIDGELDYLNYISVNLHGREYTQFHRGQWV